MNLFENLCILDIKKYVQKDGGDEKRSIFYNFCTLCGCEPLVSIVAVEMFKTKPLDWLDSYKSKIKNRHRALSFPMEWEKSE